jgi:CRP-like cAMP-binding protein
VEQADSTARSTHPLLAALTPGARRILEGSAVRFTREPGAPLIRAGDPLTAAFFVEDGMVALLAPTPSGSSAEAGLVGSGGLIGHAAALGGERASLDALPLTLTSGVAVPTEAFHAALDAGPAFRRAVLAYGLARLEETEALCACSALHPIERRLARWLTRAAELRQGAAIAITHQQIATLFGVRRASVTVSLHLLEGEHAIRCRRGRIEIRNLARLQAASCGCLSTGR